MKAITRALFVVALTLYLVVPNAMDLALPWHPWSFYGYSAAADGVVTSVDRAAAQSGLHVGDRFDLAQMPPDQRSLVSSVPLAPEGSVVLLPVISANGDRTVRLVSHVRRRTLWDNVTNELAQLSVCVFVLIAGALVLLRPLPATWAFFAFSIAFSPSGTLLLEYLSGYPRGFYNASSWLLGGLSGIAFISFAAHFPDNRLHGAARTAERALLFVYAPLVLLVSLAGLTAFFTSGRVGFTPPAWLAAFLQFTPFAVGVAVLIWRYVTADAARRNRLQWIVAAFAVAFLPWLGVNYAQEFLGILPPLPIFNCALAWETLAAAAVAYTVLKHRLFDIRFVFSRALIYAITTAVFVGIVALIDAAAGRWLSETKFALVTELGLSLAVGLSLNAFHRRIEHALNAIIFSAQIKALDALRTFAHEIDLITDPQRLLMQTFEALRTRLESQYVAIYALDGASYMLVRSTDATPPILAADDFAVLHLRRRHEAFVCEEPDHPLRGALLLPMSAHSELVGFIACGPKIDHTHYLPQETDTLATLAHRTGTAYAWLTRAPAFTLATS